MISGADVAAFEQCIAGGGVAVFPTDTLYGIGCRPGDEAAVARVYALKGRAPDKPSAVMYFSLDALPPVGPQDSPGVGGACCRGRCWRFFPVG